MISKIKFGKRRVIRMNYSRIVCLPKIWLDANDITTGDTVEFELAEDGALIVRASKQEGFP